MFKIFKIAQLEKNKVFMLMLFIALQMIGTLYLPTLTANIINNGVMKENLDYVWSTGALMLGVALLTGIFSVLGTYLSAEVSTTFSRNIREKLFCHTQELSYQDLKHFSGSSLITRATNDIEQLQSTLSMFFEMMVPAPFIVFIGLFLAFRRDTHMALIVLISSVLLVIAFGFIVKLIFPLFEKVQVGLDKINGGVSQYLSGIRVVRAFNRTKLEQKRMDDSFEDFAKLNIKINRLFAVMMPLIFLVMSIATIAIIWFGAIRIEGGYQEIGDIMAVIEYTMNILMYLVMAVFAAIYIPRAKVSANRVLEVLNYRPEIQDGEAKIDYHHELSLEFKNVSFSYEGAEKSILNNLNFTCKQGTMTAIIGGTGSGKSTVARLIPRLLDARGGQILLNGTNIKDISQEDLRDRIGFVPQKAFLFSGTIADNLKHGNEKATLSDMEQAIRIAQSERFINNLPDKYESKVLQGGKNFSGGQRQRLSIARALMKNADIYIFDDSLSALDFKTDAALRKALKPATEKSIVISVAQRISSIKDADQIIVMDEGEIVGIGTHQELLESCELYLEIAESQLTKEEIDKDKTKKLEAGINLSPISST